MDSLPMPLRFPPHVYGAVLANYLGDTAPTPYAIPALGDLAGLPPMAILTAEYDDLRPSAEAFASTGARRGDPGLDAL